MKGSKRNFECLQSPQRFFEDFLFRLNAIEEFQSHLKFEFRDL